MKPLVFKSSSVGDLSAFTDSLKDRDCSVSITFDDGFDFNDTSDFRVYIQVEPQEVQDYMLEESQGWDESGYVLHRTFDMLVSNYVFYDIILTWDERILDACPNAIFFPHCHGLDDNYDFNITTE